MNQKASSEGGRELRTTVAGSRSTVVLRETPNPVMHGPHYELSRYCLPGASTGVGMGVGWGLLGLVGDYGKETKR